MSQKMTPEERVELIQKLQDDIEDFVAERSIRARAKQEEDKSIDEIVEELQNHPAFMKEVDWSKPLSAEMEGLMVMKYESEDPKCRADSYREEGNDLFKKKDYRLAIDNYTEGIKSKSPVRLQNTILYTNRAAAQFHLGNYRSAFNDCIVARKFVPDHMKAIVRGAHCCDKMNKHADTMCWCKAGLMVDSENTVLRNLHTKAKEALSQQEQEEKMMMQKEEKEEEATLKLFEVIKSKGIQLATIPLSKETTRLKSSVLYDLDPKHPQASRVRMDKGMLTWPVQFLYPEYMTSDLVQSFQENVTFDDHLKDMFGPKTDPAVWDIEHKYKDDNLQVYFEVERNPDLLYTVNRHSTLLEVLQHKKYLVLDGTPEFIILPKNSKFQAEYLRDKKVV